jgi:hypothetical protein
VPGFSLPVVRIVLFNPVAIFYGWRDMTRCRHNGRALGMEAGEDGGFVRVVARSDDHRVLGVQAAGAHISELVGEFTLALEMGALLEDVAGTIHAHPTLTEAFHEAGPERAPALLSRKSCRIARSGGLAKIRFVADQLVCVRSRA